MPLQLSNISKTFGGSVALKNISLEIERGEVIGLVGENGAGKSTFIKILAGAHRPDSGEVRWEGRRLSFHSPADALKIGIATIHQELAYFEKLTVAENLLMTDAWPRKSWGGVDWKQLNAKAEAILAQFGLELSPKLLFHRLSSAQRQEISILRALSRKAWLIILDEPTASLTEPEVNRLMAHLKRLKAEGLTIIYVSHRLDEILRITDRVVVLRDGEKVNEYATREATIERIVRDMVGRELSGEKFRMTRQKGKVLFEAEQLSRSGMFKGISFQLHEGEILGIAGLVGAGRSELARALAGFYQPEGGRMQLRSEKWRPRSARDAARAGVVYLPEERKRQGFVLSHSIREGISIGFIEQLSRLGWISGRAENGRARQAADRVTIKAADLERPMGTLSGGNQQKALLARSLERNPEVIILDEPTRGVDVGAKAEIYQVIDELARQGKAILLISSDLPEVLSLSDRILVMRQGGFAAEFEREEATQEKILLAASGLDLRPLSW
jgi:ABC-type sugar transport system ATPase subunit